MIIVIMITAHCGYNNYGSIDYNNEEYNNNKNKTITIIIITVDNKK